jgi:phosphoribosyl 1,2-cyclic phosphate phosphodiesterase
LTITFLGTGTSQGVPVIGCPCEVCKSLDYRDKRLRSSIHIETEGQSFVVDTGPDFRQQMLRENINRLDAIFFTHAHRDHTAGLDDVRAYNFLQNMDMPVYSTQQTLDQLRNDFAYIFKEHHYPGLPRIDLRPIDDKPFIINNVLITPLPVMHLTLLVLGYRIGDFSYITDANFISEETYQKLEGTKVLVLNALQLEAHISHFTLQQAIEVAQKVKAGKTYFTHISHRMGLHREVIKQLPENIHVACDGLSIKL